MRSIDAEGLARRVVVGAPIALTAALLFAAVAVKAGELRWANRAAEHGISAQEAVDRSQRLATTVLGPAEETSFTVHGGSAPSLDGGERKVWFVDGTDEAGRYISMYVWNAATGRLMRVDHAQRRRRVYSGGRRRTSSSPYTPARSEAVQVAADWLTRLSATGKREDWAPTENTTLAGDSWYLSLRSGNRRAVVTLDAASGTLLTACEWNAAKRQ